MGPVCEEEDRVQPKGYGSSNSAHEAPSIINYVVQSAGKPLEKNTRSFMESHMGYDFSNVKIHTGSLVAKSARSINALAYTSGNSIVFNEGQYAPENTSGRKLLAHELTHVIQQDNQSVYKKVQRLDDASFEAATGVDQGISNGTMSGDTIMGNSYTTNCRFNSYDLTF